MLAYNYVSITTYARFCNCIALNCLYSHARRGSSTGGGEQTALTAMVLYIGWLYRPIPTVL